MGNSEEYMRLKVLAEGLDSLRESLRAMVAALVTDGFTDEQAREIITGLMRVSGKEATE